jgi:hypothetical protein
LLDDEPAVQRVAVFSGVAVEPRAIEVWDADRGFLSTAKGDLDE